MRQNYEVGWRSISLYTGVSPAEMRRAAAAGELGPVHSLSPVVPHRTLEAWLFARLLPAQLGDDEVEFLADQQQPPQGSAA